MKNLVFAFFLVISSATLAQDYYVLQVKGKVKSTKTGKDIKTNDVIKADEQLKFSAATDAVAVVSAKAGRFVLKPGKPNKSNEFLAYVKDALSQANNRLSTRAGIFNNVVDFKTYFEKLVYLMPEQTYEVGSQSYKISENSFFYIQYTYRGEEINKQLEFINAPLLYIERDELFKVDKEPINPEEASNFQLFHFTEEKATAITTLNFNVADPALVKAEIEVLQKALTDAKMPSAKIRDEIIAYLQENYGKVEEANVVKWLGLK
jgi:hypothetical protein